MKSPFSALSYLQDGSGDAREPCQHLARGEIVHRVTLIMNEFSLFFAFSPYAAYFCQDPLNKCYTISHLLRPQWQKGH